MAVCADPKQSEHRRLNKVLFIYFICTVISIHAMCHSITNIQHARVRTMVASYPGIFMRFYAKNTSACLKIRGLYA